MISAFFVGLLVGFVMCIPIGPINVWVISVHLRKGMSNALSIALGGSLMDFVYFYIILSGLSLLTFSDSAVFYFKAIGIGIIFILGLKEILSQQKKMESQKKGNISTLLSSFVFGIILYTSNPTLILTMTGLGAFIKSLELFIFNPINIFLVSLGLGIGSFLWFVFLVMVVDRFQEAIRQKYMLLFSRISGILMIILSMLMSYQLLQSV